MKKIIILVLVTKSLILSGQSESYLSFIFGNSFTGYGDLPGQTFGIGYGKSIKKRIHFYSLFYQSNCNGRFEDIYLPTKTIFGKTNTTVGVFDLFSIANSNKGNFKYPTNGDISKVFMTNNKSISTGLRLYPIISKSIDIFVEGRMNISKLESTFINFTNFVNVNDAKSWLNIGFQPSDVALHTMVQANYLDLGLGYGIGLRYKIMEKLKLEFAASYVEYRYDADNLSTYTLGLQYAFIKKNKK
jgi:hypothetical protein